MTVSETFVRKAQTAWGDALPEWVLVLAKSCDQSGQRKTAALIERSPALVSNVLSRRYGIDGRAGDLDAVEKQIRGTLMNATQDCPVLGEIGLNQCQHERGRPFAATSSLRARLYRSCQHCAHNPNRATLSTTQERSR